MLQTKKPLLVPLLCPSMQLIQGRLASGSRHGHSAQTSGQGSPCEITVSEALSRNNEDKGAAFPWGPCQELSF